MKPIGSIIEGINPEVTNRVNLTLLQILLFFVVSKSLSLLLLKLHFPRGIAEILTGIMFRLLANIDQISKGLFPPESIAMLRLFGDVGSIYFAFLVGAEFEPQMIAHKFRKSGLQSLCRFLAPFTAGSLVGYLLFKSNIEDPTEYELGIFIPFCGIAMAVSSFPMLARFLTDMQLLHKRIGSYTITAAGFDNTIVWITLVVLKSLIQKIEGIFVISIFTLWVGIIVIVFKRVVLYYVGLSKDPNGASHFILFIVFFLIIVSAALLEAISLPGILGGFLIGMILPHEKGFAIAVTSKIEDLVSIVFVPVFFGVIGFETNLYILNLADWGQTLLIFIIGCIGKVGSCTIAAKFDFEWRDSVIIGILLNSRGLVGIVLLDYGYRSKIINDKTFAMLIIMTILTSIITSPLVTLLHKQESFIDAEETELSLMGNLLILVVLSNLKTVSSLIKLNQMLLDSGRPFNYHALRLLELSDRMSAVMMSSESLNTMKNDGVINIFRAFGEINKIKISILATVTKRRYFGDDIKEAAVELNASWVICPIEMNKSIYPKGWGASLFDKLAEIPKFVAILLDRGFGSGNEVGISDSIVGYLKRDNVIFQYMGDADSIDALTFLSHLAHHKECNVIIYTTYKHAQEGQAKDAFDALAAYPNVALILNESQFSVMQFISYCTELQPTDLLVVGLKYYTQDESTSSLKFWLDNVCKASVLVVKNSGTAPVHAWQYREFVTKRAGKTRSLR